MSLPSGARLGPYEIVGLLGAVPSGGTTIFSYQRSAESAAYDVMPMGTRFVMIRGSAAPSPSSEIVVVPSWADAPSGGEPAP